MSRDIMKNKSTIILKLLLMTVLFFSHSVSNAAVSSDEFDNPDYAFNTIACTLNQKNDLGVCIENQTGEDITRDNFYFSEFYINKNYSESEDKPARIKEKVEPNKFINIQFSRERFSHHNPTFRPAQVKISLRTLPQDLSACAFVWHEFSPPYAKPVKVILTKTNGQYQCQWEEFH